MPSKNKPFVVILDYGSGNVKSVSNIIKYLGYDTEITKDNKLINKASHLILPGVGSYGACVSKIKSRLDLNLIKDEIINKKKPFLGICVGMQVLSTFGYEFEKNHGLNLISGEVKKLEVGSLPIPQIGWNEINIINKSKLLDEIPDKSDFYFVHSYKFQTNSKDNIIATTIYGETFTSVIEKDNIYGVQFHPEKSQKYGIKLFSNFLKIT